VFSSCSRTDLNHFAWTKRRRQKPSWEILTNEEAKKGQNKITNLYSPTAVFIAKRPVGQSNDKEKRLISLVFAVFYCCQSTVHQPLKNGVRVIEGKLVTKMARRGERTKQDQKRIILLWA